jgi:uncharacterized MnhB-related membrane protein
MLEVGAVLVMLVFAFLAIHAPMIRQAVIYLAVFSLAAAFLYVLYAAPELAVAEAVIGSGLVTLLYLAALKKNREYTIAVLAEGHRYRMSDAYITYLGKTKALQELRHFFELREFEAQLVFTSISLAEAQSDPRYDLILVEEADQLVAWGSTESFVMDELEMVFLMHATDFGIQFHRYDEPSGEKSI